MKGIVRRFFDGILAFVLVFTLVNIDSSVLVKADEVSDLSSSEFAGITWDVPVESIAKYSVGTDENTVFRTVRNDDSIVNKTDQVVNEIKKEKDNKNIKDENVPLGAAEDTCYIHWIVLILSILVVGYTIVRIAAVNRQEKTVTEES